MESGQDCAIETRSDLDQNKTDFFFSSLGGPETRIPIFCKDAFVL